MNRREYEKEYAENNFGKAWFRYFIIMMCILWFLLGYKLGEVL